MTRNQIEYWRLKETERNNRAVEKHNRNVLTYNYSVLAETKRSNLAREQETNRSNLARERETQRSNIANEQLRRLQSDRDYTLSLRQLEEQVNARKESQRLQSLSIQEQKRSNQAREAATRDSNLVSLFNAYTNRANIEEQARSNKVRENQFASQLAEQRRSNYANERLNYQRNAEMKRSNLAREGLQSFANYTQRQAVNETRRHNVSVESETRRANLMHEQLQLTHEGVSVLNNTLSTLGRLGGSIYGKEAKSNLR